MALKNCFSPKQNPLVTGYSKPTYHQPATYLPKPTPAPYTPKPYVPKPAPYTPPVTYAPVKPVTYGPKPAPAYAPKPYVPAYPHQPARVPTYKPVKPVYSFQTTTVAPPPTTAAPAAPSTTGKALFLDTWLGQWTWTSHLLNNVTITEFTDKLTDNDRILRVGFYNSRLLFKRWVSPLTHLCLKVL